MALRLVSYDPSGGATLPGDVTNDFKVTSVLAWVVVYPDSPAVVRGPGGLTTVDRANIAAQENCQWIVVFNALTGAGVDNEQLCSGVQTTP
ncbi:MAG: hypothetical protein ACR2LX_14520 [Jatrophihabitans sp.]